MAVLETNGDGKPIPQSGLYRHPDTGGELVFQETSKFGNPGADAALKLGYVYVGPAKAELANNDGPAGTVTLAADPNQGPIANTEPLANTGQLATDLEAAQRREKEAEKARTAKSDLLDEKGAK